MKMEYESGAVSQEAGRRAQGASVAILQASWHEAHTTPMVLACQEILSGAGCVVAPTYRVPGCYELPLAAKKLAQIGRSTPSNPTSAGSAMKPFEAIVVFGAIVKGDTDHYQVILETCIREIGKVMYDFDVPIIMEVLPVHRVEDLIARSKGKSNKGIEAAHAALETIAWHREFSVKV